MKLEKQIRVIELRAAISHLRGHFMSAEEAALLAAKQAELERITPTRPPFPKYEGDLRCTREGIADEVERLTRKAQPLIDQLTRETDEGRRKKILFEDIMIRLEKAQDRLERWDILHTYKLWQAGQELQRNGPPYPNIVNDLNCTREAIVADIERLEPGAQNALRLLSDPNVPESHKERIRIEDYGYTSYQAARNRLIRWGALQAWRLWKSQQEQQRD